MHINARTSTAVGLVYSLSVASLPSPALADYSSTLPIVDLGYSHHQATYNEAGKWYNFSNIRYAFAPRFGAPTPVTNQTLRSNGSPNPGICPVAAPAWLALSALYSTGQLSIEEVNSTFTQLQSLDPAANSSILGQYVTDPDKLASEDCLALDVAVPESIWDTVQKNLKPVAPVMVWIIGGGYTLGDKNAAGSPAGLIARSQDDGSDGIIHVAINYRLGLFGWLSGPDYQSQGGISNIGLHDQRAAFEWIQKNIHLFGGDPRNVTVFGESAGGGSILHQITAHGSKRGAPFNRAILQSPGFEVVPGVEKQDTLFEKALQWASFFNGATVSSLDHMKQLPFEVLWKVNQITVAASYWGAFTYGPVVDGSFVPDLPGVLLSEGRFDSSVEIFSGHNLDEGYIFASPLITNQEEYESALLRRLLPDASDDVLHHISTVLYPPLYDGTYPWKNHFQRTAATISDSWFRCNNRYISLAYSGDTFGYLFDILTGRHGEDIPYTFYNRDETSNVIPSIATRLQTYLTAFAKTGDPNVPGSPLISRYGNNSTLLSLDWGVLIEDDAANERCDWWQQALYK